MTRRLIAITLPIFAIVGAVVAWSLDRDGGGELEAAEIVHPAETGDTLPTS